ncbi:MAG: SEL1-like repeat protein [Fuerstiella sp.]
MYERYALPVRCAGLAKLAIYGSHHGILPPTEPVDGVALCWVEVSENLSAYRTVRHQQELMLQLEHSAVLSVADKYRFDAAPFVSAFQRVIEEDFRNEFCVGSQHSSPDRRLKAQVFYRFDNFPQTYLLIRDKDGVEVQRILFAHSSPDSLGKLHWVSNDKICVWHKNKSEHWLCGLDGTIQFVYPPADTGDVHAIYRLATMLLDGKGVIPDHESGYMLLELAANGGYKHAKRRLEREGRLTK